MKEYDCTIDFKEVDELLDKMAKQLDDKGANCVEAGYFENMAYPAPEEKGKKKRGNPANPKSWQIARNAWVHEKGVEGHIPARPFMTKAGEDYGKWQVILEQCLNRGLTMPKALERVGQAMRNSIINSIDEGNWAPNSPYTIKMKRGSSHPLVNHDIMKQATNYEVTNDRGA